MNIHSAVQRIKEAFLISSIAALLMVAGFGRSMAWGQQSSGDVLGSVTDSSGVVIPGTAVTITSPATGVRRTVTTQAAGEFDFANLAPGSYNLTVPASRFSTSTSSNIVVAAGDRQCVDTRMVVGGANQAVEVALAVATLQTDSSQISNSLMSIQVQNLSLSRLEYVQLMQVMPDATEGTR
jgi:hypothetical protein